MRVVNITDWHDERAAPYRDMSDDNALRQRNMFVAEGRLVVRRLLDTRQFRIHSLLLNKPAFHSLEPVLRRLDLGISVLVCDTSDFAHITGFNIHRGCLALVERPVPSEPQSLLTHAHLIVVLESVVNADNIGGVFRNAAAFGANAVLLDPTCCDPLYRKAIRTSMAATLRVPFARLDGWPTALSQIRSRGFLLAALTPHEDAMPLAAFARQYRGDRLAILVGAEGDGLTPEAEREADARVCIPIRRDVDSLNLAVATGIALAWLSETRGLG